MFSFNPSPAFIWSANENGLAIRFANTKLRQKAEKLKAPPDILRAYRRMQVLAECGDAEVSEIDDGIFIATPDAVRLDESTREMFQLPPCWPGGLRLRTESVPNLPNFTARLGLVDGMAGVKWHWHLSGPILKLHDENYLPTAAQFAALSAFEAWKNCEYKTELDHLSLLASLREAHEAGCLIYLEAYCDEGTIIAKADEIMVHCKEDELTGDLILCPLPKGNFPNVSVEEIERRLAQLDGEQPRKVIRVGKRIILLDEQQTAVARAVKARNRVPSKQKQAFECDPAKWLSDHVFPDVPIEFSPRVIGIGEWREGYIGAARGEPEDWFGAKPEPEKNERESDRKENQGRESPEKQNTSAEEKLPVLHPLIIPNDTELGYGWPFPNLKEPPSEPYVPNFSKYARQPLPHQEEAIRWLLYHARRALKNREVLLDQDQRFWGAGALLADDMGLGKSYTTLIAIAEWFRHWRQVTKTEPPAVLFVVPLSLMENWRQEICATFGTQNGPFTRVVMAQPDFELNDFRRSPGSIDIAEPGKVRKFGLYFGDGTEKSLDMAGSCVITTYQTLRDYRFSFAAAKWSAAIFDEAQQIKNPNAQQTVAAKALGANFRVALTGTPVENHLGDLWCILDTAEPGPLGAFKDFRQRWITPMMTNRERLLELGQNLRQHIGGLMLRRTKEEKLNGLPQKHIIKINCPMTREQEDLYTTARRAVSNIETTSDFSNNNQCLAALWHLRQISLHPDLIGGGSIRNAKTKTECGKILMRSGKISWLLDLLNKIQEKGEKALIFCVQRELQEALSAHLGTIYELQVPIINGDTKPTSRRNPEKTRLGLIAEFSNQPGFAVCILSPLAAGAGLNITAANHVIHLERHWNPAKEAQATDRAYRIGQEKDVTVYLPLATHSQFDSFDTILDRLLEKKKELQGALGLIPQQSVSGPELMAEIFGHSDNQTNEAEKPLSIEDALNFSWQMFEALIAVLYERESERVILTPHTADHGADVVVCGWGPEEENILIQCKSTKLDKLDSEEGVRSVCSSVPFYEIPLGITFSRKVLHTTAQKFSNRSKRAAETCAVEVKGRDWLIRVLDKHKPTLSEVLKRNAKREKI